MLQKDPYFSCSSSQRHQHYGRSYALSKEMGALATEINRIAKQTTYAGKTVLKREIDGSIYGDLGNAGS